ncbi:MAG: hypothetical protein H0V09_03605, partial [Gemmatimonadetes bacterium]|nr:hypothetical protein [Gemmatimonadota bacterium]
MTTDGPPAEGEYSTRLDEVGRERGPQWRSLAPATLVFAAAFGLATAVIVTVGTGAGHERQARPLSPAARAPAATPASRAPTARAPAEIST